MPKLHRELITAAIDGFEEQKKRINAQIAELRQMLSGDSSSDGSGWSGPTTTRRRMSAAARARIAAAQRKRWAAKRAGSSGSESTSGPVRKKRKLSAAGRKAIIEATKRRWAAVRAGRKGSGHPPFVGGPNLGHGSQTTKTVGANCGGQLKTP